MRLGGAKDQSRPKAALAQLRSAADVLAVMERFSFRLKRPPWFAPVHGFGESVGFLGGLLVLSVLGIAVVLVVTANHVTVRVHNDTGSFVRVSLCVDDVSDVEPGEDFEAGGVPEENRLLCRVTPNQGPERCVAVKVPRSAHETALLSRLPTIRLSACG